MGRRNLKIFFYFIIILIIAISLVYLSGRSVKEKYVSMKEISRNIDLYIGKTVIIKGQYDITGLDGVLEDSEGYQIVLDKAWIKGSCEESSRNYKEGQTYIAEGVINKNTEPANYIYIDCSRPIE